MKKILFVIALALVLGGCQQKPLTPQEKEEIAKMAGTWQVINVNCPNILGERNGEKKIFYARTNTIGVCVENIQPGWTIEVDKSGKSAFFPPPQPSKAAENKPQ